MSFPNPAMLPFFAAGGAISGSSFGLFYTVMMQVGYNYYGKKVLKDIEGGMSLFDALQKVQKDIQPFSDQMLQAALDAMPDVIEKSIDAFGNVINKFTDARLKDLAASWLLGQGATGGSDKIPTADVLAHLVGTHFGHVVEKDKDKTFIGPLPSPFKLPEPKKPILPKVDSCERIRSQARSMQQSVLSAYKLSISGSARQKSIWSRSLQIKSKKLDQFLARNQKCVKGMKF